MPLDEIRRVTQEPCRMARPLYGLMFGLMASSDLPRPDPQEPGLHPLKRRSSHGRQPRRQLGTDARKHGPAPIAGAIDRKLRVREVRMEQYT
jgi:hypothetical protein